MASICKIVYIDKLGDAVNEYDNPYHNTTKMKSVDVKSSTYINSSKEIVNEDPKFKIVRISKYKNTFVKGYNPSWSEEVFVIEKIKNIVPWLYVFVFSNLNREEIARTFYKKELQKINQKEFRIEKVKREKGKLYDKWKGYDNSFNSWIDKNEYKHK